MVEIIGWQVLQCMLWKIDINLNYINLELLSDLKNSISLLSRTPLYILKICTKPLKKDFCLTLRLKTKKLNQYLILNFFKMQVLQCMLWKIDINLSYFKLKLLSDLKNSISLLSRTPLYILKICTKPLKKKISV